jgi:hypothetical protein
VCADKAETYICDAHDLIRNTNVVHRRKNPSAIIIHTKQKEQTATRKQTRENTTRTKRGGRTGQEVGVLKH